MTTDVPVDLYIAAYDDPDAAREDFDALKELVKEGLIFVDVAVLVRRGDDGKIEVQENAHEVAKGAIVGAAAGFLIGLIFPPALIASTVVTGAAGAGIGELMSLHRERKIEKDLEDVLPVGSSGIITVFDEVWVAQVEKALEKAAKIDKDQVDRGDVDSIKKSAEA
jgi:uncharacterized membrane protein